MPTNGPNVVLEFSPSKEVRRSLPHRQLHGQGIADRWRLPCEESGLATVDSPAPLPPRPLGSWLRIKPFSIRPRYKSRIVVRHIKSEHRRCAIDFVLARNYQG